MRNRKLKGPRAAEVQNLLPRERLVLLAYHGSIVHGTYVPSNTSDGIDDKDLLGVFISPVEHYLGLGRPEVYEAKQDEWDIVCYELRKYVRLLLKSNPNVLGLLWTPDQYILCMDDVGALLRANRHIFVSRQAYHSFSGYAYSQLTRMERFEHQGYMGEKRKALVERHGYDTKNAAHLIRLLRMGIELLTEGELHLVRPDAAQLVAIKKGEWTLERVKEEAAALFRRAEEAYIHSRLPNRPDQEKIERLLVELLSTSLKNTVCDPRPNPSLSAISLSDSPADSGVQRNRDSLTR